VLTNNGEPQAAIVPFETLEAMHGALLQLLVSEIQGSFGRLQHQIGAESAQQVEGGKQPEPTGAEDDQAQLISAAGAESSTNARERYN
jgi:hypothetical protein